MAGGQGAGVKPVNEVAYEFDPFGLFGSSPAVSEG